MTAQLYVVMGDNTVWDYLVCAKSADDAVDYVIKNALSKLTAEPATPIYVEMFENNGQSVLGEAEDLAEWQANEKPNEKPNETNGEAKWPLN